MKSHGVSKRGVIRLLLVDDHPLIRERVAELLRADLGAEIIGEAEEAHQALELTRELQPDLLIIDLVLKNSHGLDLIREVRKEFPGSSILVLSMHEESLLAERCLLAGANGYVCKQSASKTLVQAVRTVLAGNIYLGEEASRKLALQILRRRQPASGFPTETLTDRELQVFELLGGGRSTKEIAATLKVAVRTVETYRARIKRRLGLKDGVELIRQAALWSSQTPSQTLARQSMDPK